jgi:hypothetical protein
LPLALNRAQRAAGRALPLDEAYLIARLALARAVRRYDEREGGLIPYAEKWITGDLQRAVSKELARREPERHDPHPQVCVDLARRRWDVAHTNRLERALTRADTIRRMEAVLERFSERDGSAVLWHLQGGTATEWARTYPTVTTDRARHIYAEAVRSFKEELRHMPVLPRPMLPDGPTGYVPGEARPIGTSLSLEGGSLPRSHELELSDYAAALAGLRRFADDISMLAEADAFAGEIARSAAQALYTDLRRLLEAASLSDLAECGAILAACWQLQWLYAGIYTGTVRVAGYRPPDSSPFASDGFSFDTSRALAEKIAGFGSHAIARAAA